MAIRPCFGIRYSLFDIRLLRCRCVRGTHPTFEGRGVQEGILNIEQGAAEFGTNFVVVGAYGHTPLEDSICFVRTEGKGSRPVPSGVVLPTSYFFRT